MDNYSLADLKAVMDGDDDDGVFGGNGFLWVILIFLFFLAFSGGNGLFGGNNNTNSGLTQIERDVLTTSCGTQREVLQSNYATLLGFKEQQLQLSECCCENRLSICQQTNALQAAIAAEGQATRDLINANTIQTLRDDLNGANLTLANQVLATSIVNQVRPVPIPAYVTCSPYTSAFYGCGCGNLA